MSVDESAGNRWQWISRREGEEDKEEK